MSSRDKIKVVCRIRPENKLEIQGNYQRCVAFQDSSISVTEEVGGKHTFSFDAVFGPDSKQIDVFETVAAPAVKGVLDGYNGTIFAYGQTGSGKSFTMEGVRGDD